MNATRLCRALSLLLMVIPLVGCSSSSLPTASPGKSLIQISIDWSDLARTNMQDTSVAFTSHEINAVGARLVYPGENASFTQAISKETAKKQGVITFEVPTSDQAHLYLVAVNTDTQTTFSYALTRNLVLEDNSVLPMTIADFQWVEATWIVEDGYIDAVEKEYFELPDSHNEVMVQIEVRDPFQEGKNASYETSFIFHYGVSSMRENVDGWLRFDAYFRKPRPEAPNADRHWMQPYVDGALFGLGNKGYYIPPVIQNVRVEWK